MTDVKKVIYICKAILRGLVTIMKKKILAAIFSGLVLWGGSYDISSAQEVLIHDQQYGAPYWIMTETISQTNNVITADVGYGQNKSRKHTYKFMQKDNVWYCVNPSGNQWVTVEPNSPDNDILYVVLQNINNVYLDYGETYMKKPIHWWVDLQNMEKTGTKDKPVIKISAYKVRKNIDGVLDFKIYTFINENNNWLYKWYTPTSGKSQNEASSGDEWQDVSNDRLGKDLLHIALTH